MFISNHRFDCKIIFSPAGLASWVFCNGSSTPTQCHGLCHNHQFFVLWKKILKDPSRKQIAEGARGRRDQLEYKEL